MTFNEYYKKYLTLHQNKWNRRLHVLGQFSTIIYTIWIISLSFYSFWYLLLLTLAPFVVYIFAWSGHIYFEKNVPAAWSNPWLAKLSDWKMLWQIITGRIPF